MMKKIRLTKRKTSLPIKLTVVLILSAIIIATATILALFSYPLITGGAILLGIVLFRLFVKSKTLSFIEEEYAPDYFISEHKSFKDVN